MTCVIDNKKNSWFNTWTYVIMIKIIEKKRGEFIWLKIFQ